MKCNICENLFESPLKENLSIEEMGIARESIFCKNCGSISRDRMMMWSLSMGINQKETLTELDSNKDIRILESTGVRGHPKILEEKFDYYNTTYTTSEILKKIKGKKYADFQDLRFEDNFFDFIFASDVFEHVRLDNKAFSEVNRTLKNGGYFLMTVPFRYLTEKTDVYVQTDGDRDIYLRPPEYHANHTLVYRIYGKDIFQKLNAAGFNVYYVNLQISKYMISPQEIFFCRKQKNPEINFGSHVKIAREEIFNLSSITS